MMSHCQHRLVVALASTLCLLATGAFAEDPPPPPRKTAYQSEWSLNGKKFDTLYVIYPELVLEITQPADGEVIVGCGLLKKLGDNRIEIRWLSGGVEVGKFSEITNERCYYTIEKHTDKPQIGVKHTFKSVLLSEEDTAALAKVERDLRLRIAKARLERTRQEEEIARINAEIEHLQIKGAMERTQMWLDLIK